MTKIEAIIHFLNIDSNMRTKDIKTNILNEYMLRVSDRHIQRIRKDYKEIFLKDKQEEKQEGNDNMGTMTAKQIDIINTANEGGWSVQDIANNFQVEIEFVKNTLTEFHWMVVGSVFDDENEGVYFDCTPNKESEESDDTEVSHNYLNEDVFDTEEDENEINFEHSLEDNQKTETNDDVFDTEEDGIIEIGNPIGNNIQVITGNNNKNFWETEIETVTACSRCQDEIDVYVSRNARTKAMMYMKWAGAREWLAYLIGELKDGKYYINDLFLPKQRTSSTLVDEVIADNYNEMSIVGVIHSHHEMGAGDADNPSFSGHDASFINGNHNLSLLAGRDRENGGFKVVGIARTKTPCGSLMTIKANVQSMGEELNEEEQAMKDEFLKKTQTKNRKHFNKPIGVIQQRGKTTYHFAGNGYPGNQQHFNGHFRRGACKR